ncbi:hypothetical protein KUL25_07630 [Rhodobacteraceae bacterium N5(2021)]|uniref:Uncharacterized protein n=1 Tax=Gymnodinialimonas phycosphaerae TaxID=2841589 RepID=A0ABS7MR94_9RHOB|nr:hypothetical protein [Gymnodinialimonas phycosphaerae]MBY4892634.1 hypothetical protein [Gymnodinialimonas phycosphaerae]
MAPTGAIAQVTDRALGCQTSPLCVLGYDPASAQESFATLARHTFAEDGTGPDRLGVLVVLPPGLAQDCPGGTIEPMRGIRALGDGRYEG